VRAEAARYLHDDVQSALLRASMRLQPLLQADDAATREAAERTVEDIDRVREDGVRSIGRRLSPPLTSTGLIVALGELADQYAGVVDVEVAFDEAAAERFRMVGADDRTALALYRLAEQALQNALKHGRAQAARIEVALVGSGASIVVTADGGSPVAAPVAGEGTAIVNAWVDDLGGSWSLVAGTEGGSVFAAVIGVT
jgi:signal transduction histidine kinase